MLARYHMKEERKLDAQWPLAVESSIAVEDAVENRGLYRVLFRACFERF